MNNKPNPNKRYTNFNNQQQRRGAKKPNPQNNRGRGRGIRGRGMRGRGMRGRGMRGRGKPRMLRQKGRRGRGVAMTNINQNNTNQQQQQLSNIAISRTIRNDTATSPPNITSIQSNQTNIETPEQRLQRLRESTFATKPKQSITNPMVSGIMTQSQIENEQRKKMLAQRVQRRQTLKKQPMIQQQQQQTQTQNNNDSIREALRQKAIESMARSAATININTNTNTNTNTNSTQPITSAAAHNQKRRLSLMKNKQQPPPKRIKLTHHASPKPATTATIPTNRNTLNPNAAIYQPPKPVTNKGFFKKSIAPSKPNINQQIPNQTTPTNSTTNITINSKPSTESNNIPRRQLKSYRTVPKHKDNISFTTTIFDNNNKVIKTVITTNDNNKKQPVPITNNKNTNTNKPININPTIPPIPPNLPPIIPTATSTPFAPVQQKPVQQTANIKPPAPKLKQPQNLPLNATNWACQHCTFHNENNKTTKCQMCQQSNYIKTAIPSQSSQTNKSIQSIPSISKPIAKPISKPIPKPMASTQSISKPIQSIKPKEPPKPIQIFKPKPIPIIKPISKPKPIVTTTIKPVAAKPMISKPVKIGQFTAPFIASPITSKPKIISISKPMTQNEIQRNKLSASKTAPSLSISKPITTMIKPATTKPIISTISPSKPIAMKQSKPMNIFPVKQSVVTDITTSMDAIWKQRDNAKAIQQKQQQQQLTKQQIMVNKAKAIQQRQQQQKQIQQQQQQKVINTQSISPQKRPIIQKSQTVTTSSKPKIISITAPMTQNEIQRKKLAALKPTIIKSNSEQSINKTNQSQPRTPQKMKSNVIIKKPMPSTTPPPSLQDYWKLDVTQKINNKSLALLMKETDTFIKGMNDDLKMECNAVGIQYIDPFNTEHDDIMFDIVEEFESTKKMCKQHNISWSNDVDMDEFAKAVTQCNQY